MAAAGPRHAANAFENVLAYAAALDIPLPPPPPAPEAGHRLDVLEELLETHRAAQTLARDISGSREAALSPCLSSREAVERRSALLAAALEALTAVVSNKGALVSKLRDSATHGAIAVERQHQAAFAALLEAAARDAGELSAAADDLRWAASLPDGHEAWEARLKLLPEAAAALLELHGELRDMREALAAAALPRPP
jgi:hypothetical protein